MARQLSGAEMLATLLRYVARAGVGARKEESRQAVMQLFPQEGGVLMQTAAQEWIEEGRQEGETIGLQKGKRMSQRRAILQILQYRFAPSAETIQRLNEQLDQIENDETLEMLMNNSLQAIHLSNFVQRLERVLASAIPQP
jgi:hypothetical protein